MNLDLIFQEDLADLGSLRAVKMSGEKLSSGALPFIPWSGHQPEQFAETALFLLCPAINIAEQKLDEII